MTHRQSSCWLRFEGQRASFPDASNIRSRRFTRNSRGLGFRRGRAALQLVPGGKLCPVMLKIPVAVGSRQHVQKFEMARLRFTIGELALEGPRQGGNVIRMEGQECSGHCLSSRSVPIRGDSVGGRRLPTRHGIRCPVE